MKQQVAFYKAVSRQKGNKSKFHKYILSKTSVNCLLYQHKYLENRLAVSLSEDFESKGRRTTLFLGWRVVERLLLLLLLKDFAVHVNIFGLYKRSKTQMFVHLSKYNEHV